MKTIVVAIVLLGLWALVRAEVSGSLLERKSVWFEISAFFDCMRCLYLCVLVD